MSMHLYIEYIRSISDTKHLLSAAKGELSPVQLLELARRKCRNALSCRPKDELALALMKEIQRLRGKQS